MRANENAAGVGITIDDCAGVLERIELIITAALESSEGQTNADLDIERKDVEDAGARTPAWLDGHYLWDAVLADLHHRAGNAARAERHRNQALAAAPSAAVRQLLERRLTAKRE